MFGYVYMVTNKIDGKQYIGQRSSSTVDESYFGSGRYIRKALKKYGKENFDREILEWCETREQLNEREQYYIDLYDAVNSDDFYNLNRGGEGFQKGMRFSEEHKQAISDAVSREKNHNYGKAPNKNQERALEEGRHLPASPKLKQMLSEYRKNVEVSSETRRKLSESSIGRHYITKDGINKRVYSDEIPKYLEEGWRLGMYRPPRKRK